MDDAVIKAGVWGRSPHEKKGGSRGVSPLAYEVTLCSLKSQMLYVVCCWALVLNFASNFLLKRVFTSHRRVGWYWEWHECQRLAKLVAFWVEAGVQYKIWLEFWAQSRFILPELWLKFGQDQCSSLRTFNYLWRQKGNVGYLPNFNPSLKLLRF